MELTRATMDSLFTSLNTSLNKGIAAADTSWQKWCTVINSTARLESYPMTLLQGSMRKWVGERVYNKLSANQMDVVNDDYEHSEDVNRNDIEDDKLGLYTPIFEAMGLDAETLWPSLAAEALLNNGKWADGSAFFMSTRKLGKATINNLAALAMTAANYATLRAQMMQFKNASGKPLGLIPSHVMFGPSLESTAKKVFKAELVAEDGVAVSNTNAGEVERILNPYITDDSWYLMCLTRGINPVAVQQRKKGTLIRSDRDDSPSVISRNANEYLLHYRGAAAGAVPQLVIKSKAA